jgi:hypothetical protein
MGANVPPKQFPMPGPLRPFDNSGYVSQQQAQAPLPLNNFLPLITNVTPTVAPPQNGGGVKLNPKPNNNPNIPRPVYGGGSRFGFLQDF